MLSKLAVRRLTKLVDYMESLPLSANRHFDMSVWFMHEGEHELGVPRGSAPGKKYFFDCGTTACALGWAATMPYFRRLGLKLKMDLEGKGGLYFDGYPVQWGRMEWLDLSQEQAEHLFAHNVQVSTPKQWARHCRKFLREIA